MSVSEYKEVFPTDSEDLICSVLDKDQMQRVEALIWARRVIRPANSGELTYLADYILGYSLDYEDEPVNGGDEDEPVNGESLHPLLTPLGEDDDVHTGSAHLIQSTDGAVYVPRTDAIMFHGRRYTARGI